MSKKHEDISTYFVSNKRSRGNTDEKNNLQHIHDVRTFYRFFRKKFDPPPPDKNPGYVPAKRNIKNCWCNSRNTVVR